ncbi:MSC_0622 family F1-like ATPase gamma subunit [Mycoplasma zalophi]|uniref:ATP synthase gamma chain n=1 Tax=Mycoplasma zalophi TaxID=191287 RepID=A0ABS6DPN0_9MOLU|nr:hypothetical protein [Mycoplasma zalophi]MBU4690939.1 hypothetical protein [Mycoplasma zalophi]MBU4692281.1 hypothetical protein [Mycoplasma zalophi]
MYLEKEKQRKKNLERIYKDVNNKKNILLIDILKLNKKMQFYVSKALFNKDTLMALKNEYNIKNSFITSKPLIFANKNNKLSKIFNKEKKLWIYLTEPQKHETDSYTRYEKLILSKIKNSQNDFIVIGERANEFAHDNKLNVIKSFSEEDKNDKLAFKLSYIVKHLYLDNKYSSVQVVINTNKNKKQEFTLLPLEKFDINKLINKESMFLESDIKKFKIYPDLTVFVENEVNIFLENALQSLIIESNFFNAKNNLITSNQIINQLDEEIDKMNKHIIKAKREKEIEDIVMYFTKSKERSDK